MTSQSPRIYIYKITFEEVPYYYYGVHKEKRYNEYYMGSPVTNKWYWELYTPKKQILQLFDFTDEGYIEAQEVERRLIKPFYNTDKWCLNESCGGKFSLDVRRKTGLKSKENGTGCFGITPEKRIEVGIKAGKNGSARCKELGVGIFSMTPEELSSAGKKGAQKLGQIMGPSTYERKVGVHGRTKEQMSIDGKKGGEKAAKIINNQKWMCLETGYITTSGPLSIYQKNRGIDTSKRKRIE
jgi:hypothetical protein